MGERHTIERLGLKETAFAYGRRAAVAGMAAVMSVRRILPAASASAVRAAPEPRRALAAGLLALCSGCGSSGIEVSEGTESRSGLSADQASDGSGANRSSPAGSTMLEEAMPQGAAGQASDLAASGSGSSDPAEEAGGESSSSSANGGSASSESGEARRCATPVGASGAPSTVAEMVDLLNALPRPTSVACFIESLERPLSVYATRSPLSAQPAVGEEVPRLFFLNQDLVMSVVMGGPAGDTLEFGLRVAPGRAVRGELEFPLRGSVTEETIRDRIMLGGSSLCANCHRSEQLAQAPYFGGTVVSNVVFPADQYQVGVDRLREMRDECGDSLDSRCQRFAALFDFGAVQQVPFR